MPSWKPVETIPTLAIALDSQTVELLKKLAAHFPVKAPTRKADLVDLIVAYMEGKELAKRWAELDELQQTAIAEVVHSQSSQYQVEQFVAKYGRQPNWGTGKLGYHEYQPSKLHLFFCNGILPEDLKTRLKTFVPKPIEVKTKSASTIPDHFPLKVHEYDADAKRYIKVTQDIPIRQRSTESAASQDLQTVLRLIQAGKVAVSDKTRYPGAATIKAIAAVLQGGDYYSPEDESTEQYAQEIGDIKPFAWCLLVQAGGLAELAGKKLQLTKAGLKALTAPTAETLRSIWRKWLKTTLIDEFRRIDEIKGQTGKGARSLTAVSGRRAVIAQALSECPVGKWMAVDNFFRYMKAKKHNFDVTRDPWSLYICEAGYGALGYEGFGSWAILQGRYALCLLFEYAATLGFIDVAYVPPSGVRADFSDNWGTDELEFLSRYDGLLYFCLNPLGAYALDVASAYTPAPVESVPILKVMSNQEVVVTGDLMMSDRLVLDLYLENRNDRVWAFDREKLLSALETGHTVAELHEFLVAKSSEPLPQPVKQLLSDMKERTQSLQPRGMAMMIECTTPTLAALIAHDSKTQKFCQLAGDRYLMVRLDEETKFRGALRKLGYSFPK
jgi:Helicase conserved C-terminal domain